MDEHDNRQPSEDQLPADDWRVRLTRLMEEFRAIAPAHLSDEELDAEIRPARAEARRTTYEGDT